MRDTQREDHCWVSRAVRLGLGGLLFLSGYFTALWAPWHMVAGLTPAQAADSHHASKPKVQHDHTAHEVDLAPFMMRNAYHLATLYHAARAQRWELAAYQAEELGENVTSTARVAGPYAASLQDYQKEYVQPLQQAITAQNAEQFRTAFQAAVVGCNDCHKATQHAFITIPPEPPQLSIFVFPTAGK